MAVRVRAGGPTSPSRTTWSRKWSAHGYDRIPEAAPDSRGVVATRSAREADHRAGPRLDAGARRFGSLDHVADLRERSHCHAALFVTRRRRFALNPMSRESEASPPQPGAGLLGPCAHNLEAGRRGGAAVRGGERVPPRPRGQRAALRGSADMCAIVTGPRFAHRARRRSTGGGLRRRQGAVGAVRSERDGRVTLPNGEPILRLAGNPCQRGGCDGRFTRWLGGTLGRICSAGWDIEVPVTCSPCSSIRSRSSRTRRSRLAAGAVSAGAGAIWRSSCPNRRRIGIWKPFCERRGGPG